MKNNQVVSIILMCILLSCANKEQASNRKNSDTITSSKITLQDTVPKELLVKVDTVHYEYKYFFSNDTISQTLYIKKGILSKKYEVPEAVKFKLILSDESGMHSQKSFEGAAVLASANESFSEKNDGEGDYFAADYKFNLKGCSLKIRLDIDRYAACIISTTCTDWKYFLKSYPDYDVLKRVSFKH